MHLASRMVGKKKQFSETMVGGGGAQSGPEALETWVMASKLPGGLLVQSINGNSRKTAASLAHPGLGYSLLDSDGVWQQLLCLASAWTSPSFFFLFNLANAMEI